MVNRVDLNLFLLVVLCFHNGVSFQCSPAQAEATTSMGLEVLDTLSRVFQQPQQDMWVISTRPCQRSDWESLLTRWSPLEGAAKFLGRLSRPK